MALLDRISSWEGKRAYIFRDREILVQSGGDAAGAQYVASFDVSDILIRCEDTSCGCAGILLKHEAQAPAGCAFEPMPTFYLTHDDRENTRASRMKGYADWLGRTRFCPCCGQPLRLHDSENALECPACHRLHYPRIEPCIITLISRGDEILLLRNARDTRGIYACLAGFVEIGETLEQALRREVHEETGLEVDNIRYVGSQGWPFPDQLMIAFYADYAGGEIRIQESEIADARWFRRDALPPLPTPGSIAWRLINGRFRQEVLPELKAFVEADIIPRYAAFDAAHREDHARSVIARALDLAVHYPVDINLVYAAAACHDLGLAADRKTHHLESGRIIREMPELHRWFSREQIETVAQAAEDHRASSDHAPRSLTGRIVAEADRLIDPQQIIRRTIQYGLSHYPELDREGHWQRTLDHLHEKYDYGGYLRLWIPESPNAARLEELRGIIRDKGRLRALFERIYTEETTINH